MKLPNKPRPIIHPVADAHTGAVTGILSAALSKLKLEVKEPGTDIQLGTTFYTPVVTLLARVLGTRRQDLVFCTWPLLGCPYYYFEGALPMFRIRDQTRQGMVNFKEMLDTRMLANQNRPAVLWEILDLLQSVCGWDVRQLVEWTREVERRMQNEHAGVLIQLQSMADVARQRHDTDGMQDKEIGLAPGVVVPVSGPGRVN
jgi:hypothetical protein